MSRITLQQSPSSVEVELPGDHVFDTVPFTRSREIAVEDLQAQANSIDRSDYPSSEDAMDAMVALLCEIADHLMVPQAGKRKRPSAVLLDLWKADELTIEQLKALLDDVSSVVSQRPT